MLQENKVGQRDNDAKVRVRVDQGSPHQRVTPGTET